MDRPRGYYAQGNNSDIKTNTVYYQLHMESKKANSQKQREEREFLEAVGWRE